jgi:hypothetical protein
MDICVGLVWLLRRLVWIFAQIWYGYWCRLSMDICAGLVWIFAQVWYGYLLGFGMERRAWQERLALSPTPEYFSCYT